MMGDLRTVTMNWFCLLLVASLPITVIGQSDCPEVQVSDLGNNTIAASTGLVYGVLAARAGDGTTVNPLQILEYNIVCLAQSTMRDTYRYASIVIRYMQSGSETTIQMDIECGAGPQWTGSIGNSNNVIINPPDGNLTTERRYDCESCARLDLFGGSGPDDDQHCLECPSECTSGLMRCTDFTTCCSYFHNGMCVSACPAGNFEANGNFECVCMPGYTGSMCDIDIDDCATGPCLNGATCTDLVNDFNCTCAAGYTGDTCATDIDDCASSPCLNGATCTDLVNDFNCTCAAGYTGDTCATKMKPATDIIIIAIVCPPGFFLICVVCGGLGVLIVWAIINRKKKNAINRKNKKNEVNSKPV